MELPLVRRLPKVELHAHLTGSITQEFLCKHDPQFSRIDVKENIRQGVSALDKCFQYFDAVNGTVTSLAMLKLAALDVFADFAAQNCLYLEIRSTAKIYSDSQSLSQYVETVRAAAQEHTAGGSSMQIKLLVSIDRGTVRSAQGAIAQVRACLDLYESFPDFVVGLDVCGNPTSFTIVDCVVPALKQQKAGYAGRRGWPPITFHTGETDTRKELECIVESVIELNIRRLGHCVHLVVSHFDLFERLLAEHSRSAGYREHGPMGVELCPTSNLCVAGWTAMDQHHFSKLRALGQSGAVLLSLNSDDAGLFNCDLSTECHEISSAFGVGVDEFLEIQRAAIRSSFHPDPAALLRQFDAAVAAALHESPRAVNPTSSL
jgi:adenosine deaminase